MLFYKHFSSIKIVGDIEDVSWCVIAALHFPRYVFAIKAFIYINIKTQLKVVSEIFK